MRIAPCRRSAVRVASATARSTGRPARSTPGTHKFDYVNQEKGTSPHETAISAGLLPGRAPQEGGQGPCSGVQVDLSDSNPEKIIVYFVLP